LLKHLHQLLDEEQGNPDIVVMGLRLLGTITSNHPDNKRRVATAGFIEQLASFIKYYF